MQLFIVSRNPEACAQYLDNARVVKIATEAAQMLSTAIRERDNALADKFGLYKAFNPNHPVVTWVRTSRENWEWARQYQQALCHEYRVRFGRHHKTEKMFNDGAAKQLSVVMPPNGLTRPANAARNTSLGLDFTHLPVCRAYREYLNARWLMEAEKERYAFAWLSNQR
jgi:hypothetical protein